MYTRHKLYPRKGMLFSRVYFDVADKIILAQKNNIDKGQYRHEPGANMHPFAGKNIDEMASHLISLLHTTHTLLTSLVALNTLRQRAAIWTRAEQQAQLNTSKRTPASKRITHHQRVQIEDEEQNQIFSLITSIIDWQLDALEKLETCETLPRYNPKFLRIRAANCAFMARRSIIHQNKDVILPENHNIFRHYAWSLLDITSEVYTLYGIKKEITEMLEKDERKQRDQSLAHLFNITVKPKDSIALQKAREHTRQIRLTGVLLQNNARIWMATAERMSAHSPKRKTPSQPNRYLERKPK